VKPVVSSTPILETPMALAATDTVHDIAQEASLVFEGRCSLPLFSARHPAFDLDEAYRASALAHKIRLGKGYKFVGRKAGFTNSRIWDEYGVRAPNWGYVYDRTLHDLATPFSLAPCAEPKIEPEIIVGLSAAPSPDMDDAALLGCIGWLAHGFEIVQSVFPNWKFTAPDSVAVNAMHCCVVDRAAPRNRLARGGVAARPARMRSRTILRRHVDGSRPRLERARRAAVGHPSRDPAA